MKGYWSGCAVYFICKVKCSTLYIHTLMAGRSWCWMGVDIVSRAYYHSGPACLEIRTRSEILLLPSFTIFLQLSLCLSVSACIHSFTSLLPFSHPLQLVFRSFYISHVSLIICHLVCQHYVSGLQYLVKHIHISSSCSFVFNQLFILTVCQTHLGHSQKMVYLTISHPCLVNAVHFEFMLQHPPLVYRYSCRTAKCKRPFSNWQTKQKHSQTRLTLQNGEKNVCFSDIKRLTLIS